MEEMQWYKEHNWQVLHAFQFMFQVTNHAVPIGSMCCDYNSGIYTRRHVRYHISSLDFHKDLSRPKIIASEHKEGEHCYNPNTLNIPMCM